MKKIVLAMILLFSVNLLAKKSENSSKKNKPDYSELKDKKDSKESAICPVWDCGDKEDDGRENDGRLNDGDGFSEEVIHGEFLSLILSNESLSTEEKRKQCREVCLIEADLPSAELKACILGCEKI